MSKTWMQDLAWNDAWRLLERCNESPKQMKIMGFKTIGDAATFEFNRIYGLSKEQHRNDDA